MTRREFTDIIANHSLDVANDLVGGKKPLQSDLARKIVMGAYQLGAQNALDFIKEHPGVLRNKIGFIQ